MKRKGLVLSKIKKKKHYFTKQEDCLIKKLFRAASWEEIETVLPGRGRESIRRRGGILKVVRDMAPNRKVWTPKEEAILREYYPYASREELFRRLPNRKTWQVICRHACLFGIRRFVEGHRPWTARETAILLKHYATGEREKILKLLPGRDWQAISLRGGRLGLRRIVQVLQREQKYKEAERELKAKEKASFLWRP